MEILKHVKETKPYIPVVMITAYGTINQAVEALKEGAMDYVVKPFDVEELKAKAREYTPEEAAEGKIQF